jgi:hypothetical protein
MKWTLIASERLEMEVARMAGTARGDEFLEGAKWMLERNAGCGRQVRVEPPLYALCMEADAQRPRLSLFYTIDYDKVLLLSLSQGNEAPAPPGIGPEAARY